MADIHPEIVAISGMPRTRQVTTDGHTPQIGSIECHFTERSSYAGKLRVSTESYGGLKKGFLNKSECNDVPFIQASGDFNRNPLVLPEVQKAIGREWITPDLIDTVSRELGGSASEGELNILVEMMQKDPAGARALLERDSQLSAKFKRFLSMMGNHFEKLGLMEQEVQSPLSRGDGGLDQVSREILKDKAISNLINAISSGRKVSMTQVAAHSEDFKRKLKHLIEHGVLSFTS